MASEALKNLQRIGLLDGLRKQRNLSDYDGELITEAALKECIAQAQRLLDMAQQRWSHAT